MFHYNFGELILLSNLLYHLEFIKLVLNIIILFTLELPKNIDAIVNIQTFVTSWFAPNSILAELFRIFQVYLPRSHMPKHWSLWEHEKILLLWSFLVQIPMWLIVLCLKISNAVWQICFSMKMESLDRFSERSVPCWFFLKYKNLKAWCHIPCEH